jgi:hypothetical protein
VRGRLALRKEARRPLTPAFPDFSMALRKCGMLALSEMLLEFVPTVFPFLESTFG